MGKQYAYSHQGSRGSRGSLVLRKHKGADAKAQPRANCGQSLEAELKWQRTGRSR